MRKFTLLAAAAAVTALVGVTPAFAKAGDKIEGSYICVFKAGAVSRANAHAEANRAAGASLGHVYDTAIRGFSAHMSASAIAQLKSRNSNIAYCEQDQEVDAIEGGPFDFRIVGRPSGSQPVQSVPWGVARVHGGTGTGAGSGTAWVIDTGIDLIHPDLNVDAARSRNFVEREILAERRQRPRHPRGRDHRRQGQQHRRGRREPRRDRWLPCACSTTPAAGPTRT